MRTEGSTVADVERALLEQWDPTIIAISRATARRFGPVVDWEDVAQELRLWWLKHAKRVEKYLDDEDAGSKLLMRALSLEASGFCQVEKARHLGYRVEDLFFYNTGALRELLPLVFDYECWVEIGQQRGGEGSDGGRGSRAPAEGNNLVTVLADVHRGLSLVNESDRQLIFDLYREGLSEAELAERSGVTAEAVNKRHDRALARLRDVMGGERPPMHEGPGARHALSNAAARAATEV